VEAVLSGASFTTSLGERAPMSVAPSSPAFTDARVAEVVDAHYDFVRRSLRRLGVLDGDADDCAQQVFCVFASRMNDVKREKEKAFLFGTAAKVAQTARRTTARRKEIADDDALAAIAAPTHRQPDEMLDAERARVVLDAILDSIPTELRMPFVLYEIEEMTMAEIAETLEIPTGTVASRLKRGREHFRILSAEAQQRISQGGEP
jgi:RNA polymerase sigma-70 factor (ECF subfamily)